MHESSAPRRELPRGKHPERFVRTPTGFSFSDTVFFSVADVHIKQERLKCQMDAWFPENQFFALTIPALLEWGLGLT